MRALSPYLLQFTCVCRCGHPHGRVCGLSKSWVRIKGSLAIRSRSLVTDSSRPARSEDQAR